MDALLRQEGQDFMVGANDIPVWGRFEIYESRAAALATVQEEDKVYGRCRVLHVANNEQLRRLLLVGTEVCSSKAELYLLVDPTCPIYWAMGQAESSDYSNQMEITSRLPIRGTRDSMLSVLAPSHEKGNFVLTARVARNVTVDKGTSMPVYIKPDVARVVGSWSALCDEDMPSPMSSTGSDCLDSGMRSKEPPSPSDDGDGETGDGNIDEEGKDIAGESSVSSGVLRSIAEGRRTRSSAAARKGDSLGHSPAQPE